MMHMTPIDWGILFVVVLFFTVVAYRTRKYTRSVADFLAANRCAGRYVLAVGEGMAALGAISAIAMFQMYFEGGFTPFFWNTTIMIVSLFVTISGWVIYRFRQTRALTWPEFFEKRYSKRFRVFAGSLCFLAGIINFGIFPSVAARFMVYYTGLETSFDLWGIAWSTYGVVMALIISLAVWYACLGGQIAVIVTDFLQGLFCNVVFIVLLVFLFIKFSWSDIATVLIERSENQSMVNPFKIQGLGNYDMGYYFIGIWVAFYSAYSWQGMQGYNTSAKNAHEARMSKILGMLRPLTYSLLILLLPLCAYVILHHPKFLPEASIINNALGGIDNNQIRSQMTVPVTLSYILPQGLMGLFATVIFVFFLSTVNTYLHSWGSIVIQDVILPFRKKPLSPKSHLKLLRASIITVAIFIWCFSYYFRQRSDILMFFALAGMIYLCGQGAVTIGGLYWKRGTTAGAWTAMLIGLLMFFIALILDQFWGNIATFIQSSYPHTWLSLKNTFPTLTSEKFFLTAQELYFFAMLICLASYILVSYLTCKTPFNLDKMLHRGQYALANEQTVEEEARRGQKSGWDWKEVFGFKKNTPWGDRIIFYFTYAYLLLNILAIAAVILWELGGNTTDAKWLSFWHGYIWVGVALTLGTIIWFAIGGIRDLKDLFKNLATVQRNDADAGTYP